MNVIIYEHNRYDKIPKKNVMLNDMLKELAEPESIKIQILSLCQ